MYYNGYVLTLWGHLAGLLYRTHPDKIFSSECISNSPHLAFLLLRFIECSTFIRDSSFSGAKVYLPIEPLLTNLSNIIDADGVPTELKARAMAIRIVEKYNWLPDRVDDMVTGEPVDEQGKAWAMTESAKAITMMEGVSGKSCVLVYLARIFVENGMYKIQDETWNKAMAQSEHFVDREDLYATVANLVFMTLFAQKFLDRDAFKKIIPAVHEAKSLALGEWDGVFRRTFGFVESLPLYKECEQKPDTGKESSKKSSKRGSSFSKIAETAATAAADDMVKDAVNALFNNF